MGLLIVALLTTQDVLLARSFVPLTKQRLDNVLRSCCRLLEIEGETKDHSFIEADSVRYLYLPLGSMYLVLTTTKASNIVEDLATLRMLQTIVQHKLPSQITAELIEEHAFDLIFAFDECASFGQRESVTLKQIQAYTAAESYEEQIAIQLRKQKEKEETRKRRNKAMEFDKKRREENRAKQMADNAANLQASAALVKAAFGSATKSAFTASQEMSAPHWGESSFTGAPVTTSSLPEEVVTSVQIQDQSIHPNGPRRPRGMQLGKGRIGGLRGGGL